MTNKRLRKAITEYIENLEKNLFKELDEENFDLANELYDTSKLKELLAETAPASLTSKEKAKYAMAMSDAMDEAREIIDNLIWDMWTTDGIGEGFTADEEDHLAQATAFLAKYKRTDR